MAGIEGRRLLFGIGNAVLFAALCIALSPDGAWAGHGHGGGGGNHGGGHGSDDDDSDHDSDDDSGGHHDDDDDSDRHDDDDSDHDSDDDSDDDDDSSGDTLYIWGSNVSRMTNDFLAVIDFDEHSPTYGQVLSTVDVGTSGNEAHHCGLSADKSVLACGGLLSVLKGQGEIFFFDVSDPRNPTFIESSDPPQSSITDDFVGLAGGGFFVTMMGSASGGPGGRVAEYDADLHLVHEWPDVLPADGTFNPHGIGVRDDLNLMVTADFINPASTLNIVPGDPELRHAIRVWDLASRTIVRTVDIPSAIGTMDVKLIPGDPEGRAITAGMFDGLVYLIDTTAGTYTEAFDCEDVVPHVETSVDGGMIQLITMPSDGNRLLFASFEAGQVGMLDISDRDNFVQVGLAVDVGGLNAGPHNHVLAPDEERLVVANYFLDEDDFGKIHFDGNHEVHVVKVDDDGVEVDPDFQLDFDTAFSWGPSRPHGIAIK